MSGRPVASVEADQGQMKRFADAYRARGGKSQALVDAWVAAATKKQP